MRTSDSRNRREIAELARLLPVPAEWDLPAGRRRTLKENLMSELNLADGTATGRPPVPRRPKRAILATAAGASALAVAAAAVAVVVTSGTAGPATSRGGGPAAATLSARQILLAAATTAAARPESTGTYWYVKTTVVVFSYKDSEESWTRLDGQTWLRGSKVPGWFANEDSFLPPSKPPVRFGLAGGLDLEQLQGLPPRMQTAGSSPASFIPAGELTFGQLQKLPASPAALKAWITAMNRTFDREEGAPVPEREAVFESLNDLVAGVPAPPQVRAAAFRVMASLPGVTSLGPVSGGQGLRISLSGNQHATLVVDPATSQVTDTLTVSNGNSVSVIAGWTSQLP
jgi:hypothetical protein